MPTILLPSPGSPDGGATPMLHLLGHGRSEMPADLALDQPQREIDSRSDPTRCDEITVVDHTSVDHLRTAGS